MRIYHLCCHMQVTPREAELQGVFDGRQWPVYVRLSNNKIYGADLVISAIGVQPNSSWVAKEMQLSTEDNGIVVDRYSVSLVPNKSRSSAQLFGTRPISCCWQS